MQLIIPCRTPHSAWSRCGLNFPQKVARQFDGNVVFSRYLAAIFAAFETNASRYGNFGGYVRLFGGPVWRPVWRPPSLSSAWRMQPFQMPLASAMRFNS